jgi:hypothetical protein
MGIFDKLLLTVRMCYQSPGAVVACAAIRYREYQEVKVPENFVEFIPVQDRNGAGIVRFFFVALRLAFTSGTVRSRI